VAAAHVLFGGAAGGGGVGGVGGVGGGALGHQPAARAHPLRAEALAPRLALPAATWGVALCGAVWLRRQPQVHA